MDKLIEWIFKNKLIITIICLVAIVGIPVLIHVCFILPAPIEFLKAKWGAGDLLGYYGTILTFVSTTILGIVALKQTNILERKNTIERNIIRFSVEKQRTFLVLYSEDICDCMFEFNISKISEQIPMHAKLTKISASGSDHDVILEDIYEDSYCSISVEARDEIKLGVYMSNRPEILKIFPDEKVIGSYRKGLLSEYEISTSWKLYISLEFGFYSNDIVTPILVMLYLDIDSNSIIYDIPGNSKRIREEYYKGNTYGKIEYEIREAQCWNSDSMEKQIFEKRLEGK